jgi:hypothetical protein
VRQSVNRVTAVGQSHFPADAAALDSGAPAPRPRRRERRSSPPGSYTPVPHWLMGRTSPAAIGCFVALGQYADATRACWPSVRQLAADMGTSATKTKLLLAELVAAGAVLREPRYAECESGKRRQTSSRYRLAGTAGPGDFAPATRRQPEPIEPELDVELLDADEQRAWNAITAAEPELAELDAEPDVIEALDSELDVVLDSRATPPARIRATKNQNQKELPPPTPRSSRADAESVRRLLGERISQPVKAAPALTAALAARLDDGWSEQALVAALVSRELPTELRSATALLASRAERLGAPERSSAMTERARERVKFCARCGLSACECAKSAPPGEYVAAARAALATARARTAEQRTPAFDALRMSVTRRRQHRAVGANS